MENGNILIEYAHKYKLGNKNILNDSHTQKSVFYIIRSQVLKLNVVTEENVRKYIMAEYVGKRNKNHSFSKSIVLKFSFIFTIHNSDYI